MDLGLAGKVAIVAGASRGIGKATALVLAGGRRARRDGRPRREALQPSQAEWQKAAASRWPFRAI